MTKYEQLITLFEQLKELNLNKKSRVKLNLYLERNMVVEEFEKAVMVAMALFAEQNKKILAEGQALEAGEISCLNCKKIRFLRDSFWNCPVTHNLRSIHDSRDWLRARAEGCRSFKP